MILYDKTRLSFKFYFVYSDVLIFVSLISWTIYLSSLYVGQVLIYLDGYSEDEEVLFD